MRDAVDEHPVVLDLRQPSDNANQDRFFIDIQFLSKPVAACWRIREDAQIKSKRNHFDLPFTSDAKVLSDLRALLCADDQQPISNQSRQYPLDCEKEPGPGAPIIAMKNVTVIGVHEFTPARPPDESCRRQPAI